MKKRDKTKKGIKAIIFDLGGVVVLGKSEDIFNSLSKKLEINSNSLQLALKRYKKAMLKGRLSPQDFSELLRKKFHISADIIQKRKESYLEVMPINKDAIALIKKLKKDYKIALITNMNKLHASINRDRGLFSYFRPAILSCEVGLIKPEKEIFELALKKMRLNAENCILLEDREEHLKIPEELGFKTILFKNNEQLIKDLRRQGVET